LRTGIPVEDLMAAGGVTTLITERANPEPTGA
jgi:hypothetical protein